MSCAYCFSSLLDLSETCVLTCGHEFHTHCILKWMSIKGTCPTCRNKGKCTKYCKDPLDIHSNLHRQELPDILEDEVKKQQQRISQQDTYISVLQGQLEHYQCLLTGEDDESNEEDEVSDYVPDEMEDIDLSVSRMITTRSQTNPSNSSSSVSSNSSTVNISNNRSRHLQAVGNPSVSLTANGYRISFQGFFSK